MMPNNGTEKRIQEVSSILMAKMNNRQFRYLFRLQIVIKSHMKVVLGVSYLFNKIIERKLFVPILFEQKDYVWLSKKLPLLFYG